MEGFGAELAGFRRRVDELRAARALPEGDHLPTLDAALFELQHAAEVLWPRYERLAAARRRGGSRDESHEQQVLRALFRRLPVAVALMDRDGVVRRLNVAASQLFGMRPGYAAGRPLTGSITHEGRPAFRTQVAAVARGEGARSLRVGLMHSEGTGGGTDGPGDGPTRLRVTLTSLRPPQEPRNIVLAVFQPAVDGAAGASVAGVQPAEDAAATPPDLGETARHTGILDLVDDVAAELMVTEREPDVVAAHAAAVLHQRFADWVIVDVRTRGELLRRAVVLGPDGTVRKSLLEQRPCAVPLVNAAVDEGVTTIQARPEDLEAFGRDGQGAPMLVRADVGSLICAPLSAAARGDAPPCAMRQAPSPGDGPGPARGALTLFRMGTTRAFELAEAAAVGRIARHIALALGPV